MKLHTEEREIQRRGISGESSFSIKMSAKSFSLLSSKLYSNKPLAVIREITCNAWDSHVDAGNEEKSVEITLPTFNNPTFSVKDFGTGLSNEDVLGMYTTFFESTKENTNEAIGAFGLGSKAPFAISDSFTVVSRYSGKSTTYLVFLNEEKIPSITEISKTDCGDDRGMTVTVPVPSSETSVFEQEADNFFSLFLGNVEFIGKQISPDKLEPILELDKSTFYPDVNNWTKFGWFARIGGVVYPLDADVLSSNSVNIGYVLNCGVILDFDIGELDIAPSREELSYDKKTISCIEARVDELLETIDQHFVTKRKQNRKGDVVGLFKIYEEHSKIINHKKEFYSVETNVNVKNSSGEHETKTVRHHVSTVIIPGKFDKKLNSVFSIAKIRSFYWSSNHISGNRRIVLANIDSLQLDDLITGNVFFKDTNYKNSERIEKHLGGRKPGVIWQPEHFDSETTFDEICKFLSGLGLPNPVKLSSIEIEKKPRNPLSPKAGYFLHVLTKNGISKKILREKDIKVYLKYDVSDEAAISKRLINENRILGVETITRDFRVSADKILDIDIVSKTELIDTRFEKFLKYPKMIEIALFRQACLSIDLDYRSLKNLFSRGTFEYEFLRLCKGHSEAYNHSYSCNNWIERNKLTSLLSELTDLIKIYTAEEYTIFTNKTMKYKKRIDEYAEAMKKQFEIFDKSPGFQTASLIHGDLSTKENAPALKLIKDNLDIECRCYRKPANSGPEFILSV